MYNEHMISMESENDNRPPIESVLPELKHASHYDLPGDPRELPSESELKRLNAELARLADLRRRVEVESRDISMA